MASVALKVWAAVASEPEPEALAKLKRFLGLPPSPYQSNPAAAAAAAAAMANAADAAESDPSARAALGRQQLGAYESASCGFTVGHLCASRRQVRAST